MKKALFIILLPLAAMFNNQACAQVVTRFGDQVGTLNGIMKAYYDVVSTKKGVLPSYSRDSCLHIPDARCGMIVSKKDGSKSLTYISLKEYHRRSDASLAKDGFSEKEIGRKVEQFGNIYHVWSTYESRNTPTGPIIERGINSVELYNDGKRFWIISWYFDNESKTNPLPKKYLTY